VLRLFVAVLSYLLIVLGLLFGSLAAMGQETSPLPDAPQPTHSQTPQPTPKQPGPQHELSKNHIFWVIPNYRSDENATQFKPLTPRAKMQVAFDDSFDPSDFLVAGIFAGVGMVQRQ
ncbi:MAG: hypothetical protein WA734_16015, partial [Candidatus Acidiferrales bacterium]